MPAPARPRPTSRPRSGAPSCDVRRHAACRRGGGGRPDRPAQRRSRRPRGAPARCGPVPSRLTIAVGASAAVEPSGRAQIARMCCSNCDVAAPSMVQWPLLWTRGASSLTTSSPSGIRNSSAVSVPTMPMATASRSPRSAARSAISAGTGAGATDSARIPASCVLRASGKVAERPSDAAGHDDRYLHLERHLGLGQDDVAGWATEPLERPIDVGGGADPDLAPAVVPAGGGLDPQRQPELVGRLTQVVRRPDLAPGRDRWRRPPPRSVARRCDPGSRAAAADPAGPARRRRRASTTATATCSSSYVTTSLEAAKRRAPPTSSYPATTWRSARAAVGQSGSGSMTAIR